MADCVEQRESESEEDGGSSTTTTAISINFFAQPDDCRQFGLEVQHQIFWLPKDGLCAYSPVFKRMLYGQFAESKRKTVPLPNKSASDVHELLLCLFPTPIVKKVDEANVNLLLAFADEYEIADLTSRCCDFLRQKLDQLRNGDERLLEVLVLASKHRLTSCSILYSVVKRCAECFELDKFEAIFHQLSSEVLRSIAWHKCQQLRSTTTNNHQDSAAASLLSPSGVGQHQQQQQQHGAQHFPTTQQPCNHCRSGLTQNRCTTCGGAQRCPLCYHIPRRSRSCACNNFLVARGASFAFVSTAADTTADNNGSDSGSGDKSNPFNSSKKGGGFDGATALLQRL